MYLRLGSQRDEYYSFDPNFDITFDQKLQSNEIRTIVVLNFETS